MEILLDNCVASVLYGAKTPRELKSLPPDILLASRLALHKGLGEIDHELVCFPTLLTEFNGKDFTKISFPFGKMRYVAKCVPETTLDTPEEFLSVHYSNLLIFEKILQQAQDYLGADFKSDTPDIIEKRIQKKFGVTRKSGHYFFLTAKSIGRSKVWATPIEFKGRRSIEEGNCVSAVICGFSDDRIARIFMSYILSSVYCSFSNDVIFPMIVHKKRCRKSSFLKDFLYMFFSVDRDCMFLTADNALAFKCASIFNLFECKSFVVQIDIAQNLLSSGNLMMKAFSCEGDPITNLEAMLGDNYGFLLNDADAKVSLAGLKGVL